jgi:hypothetical protein
VLCIITVQQNVLSFMFVKDCHKYLISGFKIGFGVKVIFYRYKGGQYLM